MIKFINLNFFKGGSSTETVEKREPKSDQLKAMDDALYSTMGGLLSRYGGYTTPQITSYSAGGGSGTSAANDGSWFGKQSGGNSGWNSGSYLDTAFDTADSLAQAAAKNSANLLNTAPSYLSKADANLDTANKYAIESQEQSKKNNANADWYIAQHQELLNNGSNEGLLNALSEMNKSVYSGMNESAANGLADWAARGVVNSSTANKALQGIEGEAAKAAASNYGSLYNTMLENYLSGANTSNTMANDVLTNGNKTVSNLTGIADGYRSNYDSALKGLETYAGLPQQYYSNALAPLSPAYNYWKDSTNAWLANDKDTVVTSGGK